MIALATNTIAADKTMGSQRSDSGTMTGLLDAANHSPQIRPPTYATLKRWSIAGVAENHVATAAGVPARFWRDGVEPPSAVPPSTDRQTLTGPSSMPKSEAGPLAWHRGPFPF